MMITLWALRPIPTSRAEWFACSRAGAAGRRAPGPDNRDRSHLGEASIRRRSLGRMSLRGASAKPAPATTGACSRRCSSHRGAHATVLPTTARRYFTAGTLALPRRHRRRVCISADARAATSSGLARRQPPAQPRSGRGDGQGRHGRNSHHQIAAAVGSVVRTGATAATATVTGSAAATGASAAALPDTSGSETVLAMAGVFLHAVRRGRGWHWCGRAVGSTARTEIGTTDCAREASARGHAPGTPTSGRTARGGRAQSSSMTRRCRRRRRRRRRGAARDRSATRHAPRARCSPARRCAARTYRPSS